MKSDTVYPIVQDQPQAPPMYTMPAGAVISQPQQQRQWSTELCGCCEDVGGCLLTHFCGPCELCCCVSERMGEQCCTPLCLGDSVTLIAYRVKLRTRHGIEGSILNDCCLTVFCGSCVQCQLKRELSYIENNMGGRPAF